MKRLVRHYKNFKLKTKGMNIKDIANLVIHSNHDPFNVALGFSIGLFFSILPLFALGMFIALGIAWYKKLNLLSTYLATMIVNPLNASLVYFIDYKVGSFFLGSGGVEFSLRTLHLVAGQMLLGGVIVAFGVSFVTFFIVYGVVVQFRRLKHK